MTISPFIIVIGALLTFIGIPFSDGLIVSDFNIVNNLSKDCLSIDNNELGKIQILKAKGLKCDRCWHYQKITVKGIENTKLCKRCSNIINL